MAGHLAEAAAEEVAAAGSLGIQERPKGRSFGRLTFYSTLYNIEL